jgi:hypothetical protein
MPKSFAVAIVVISVEAMCFFWLSDSPDRWVFGLTLAVAAISALIFYLRVK